MGTPAEFLLEAFAGRSQAPVCILCLPNIRGAFPPSEIYTRDLAEAEAFVKERDGPGAAIYFGANTTLPGRKRNKDNVAEIVTLHADLDFKTIAASPDIIDQVLRALPLPPSTIVDSGNGFHGYWRFREALPPELRERVEAALRRLAWALAGDPAVCEIARIMRLPGSHNTKDGAWKPVLVRWNSRREYSLDELETWLSGLERPFLTRLAPPPKAGKNGNGHDHDGLASDGDPFAAFGAEVKPIPIDVEDELDAMEFGGTDGNGVNLTQLRVIGSLLHEGVGVEQAIDYVVDATWARVPEALAWDRAAEVRQLRDMATRTFKGRPELLDLQDGGVPAWLAQRLGRTKAAGAGGDLKALFDAATGAGPDPAPAVSAKKTVPRLKGFYSEALEGMPLVRREWVVQDFILAWQLNALLGDGGMGKDQILFQLGVAMTTGQQWLGRDVMQGRVLYYPVEDDLEELVRRHRAIMKHYGISASDFPEMFKIVPMLGGQTVIGVFNQRSGLVEPTPIYESMRLDIEEFKPTLVIVGNRVNIFSVDQVADNHAVQSLQLLSRLCVQYRTTVIMPGHPSLRGQSTGEGTSGSVQWSNGVRSRCYLRYPEREKNEKPDISRRELEVMKINYAPTGTIIPMQWQSVEVEGQTLGVFAADPIQLGGAAKPVPRDGESETQAKVRVAQETVEADDAMFLRTLDRHSAMGSFVSAAPTSHTNAPNIFSQDEECLSGVRIADKKRRMKAAMNRLFARKVIDTVQWDSPSKNKWRIERTKFQVVK